MEIFYMSCKCLCIVADKDMYVYIISILGGLYLYCQ
jgi:hypothetical protein